MIAIATASQKGGVGKTTLCINLAYSLARRGWRVLLIDTDPQGGVGLSLAKSTKAREGFHEFLVRGGDLSKMVVSTRLPELEIVPAGQYDTCARQGWSLHEVPARLADLLRGAELRGVDVVLNSLYGEATLAIRSVPHLLETLARFRAEGAGVRVAGILLTMVMRENEMSLKVARELREMLPANLMFQQSIPRLSSFLEASALGVPVALTKRNPPPEALIFDQIAAELEQRTGLTHEREKEHGHASLMD